MKIKGYGNASVRITAEGKDFYFDPYLKSLAAEDTDFLRHRRKRDFLKAENVLITHGHLDHLASITPLYRNTKAQIYCTKTPAATLRKQGFPEERINIIVPGDELVFGNVRICVHRTKHCVFDRGELFKVIFRNRALLHFLRSIYLLKADIEYPCGDECVMYEISAEGKRVQLLGSAGLDDNTEYSPGADVLILPYQGRSDMDIYCAGIAERLNPKEVIIDHYDNAFPPLTGGEDTGKFTELMKHRHPEIRCRVLDEEKTFFL